MRNVKQIRIICFISAIVMCLFSFSACSAKYGEYSVNTKTVAKVGKYKISYDEYKTFYNGSKEELEAEGITDFSKEENLVTLRKLTETRLKQRYSIRFLADKYKVKLTETDKEYVDQVIEYYVNEAGGMDKFREWLSEANMTGTVFRNNVEMLYCYDVSLRNLLFTGYENIIPMDNVTIKQDVLDNFYHYQAIYLSFDTGDDFIDNLAYITEAYERLEAGADFGALAKEYAKHNATVYSTEGYTTEGEKEFFDVLKNLEIGEYCKEAFRFDYDLAIIKRLPLDESYIDEHIEELGNISATRRYNEYLESVSETLEVTYTSYYDKVTHEMLTEPLVLKED